MNAREDIVVRGTGGEPYVFKSVVGVMWSCGDCHLRPAGSKWEAYLLAHSPPAEIWSGEEATPQQAFDELRDRVRGFALALGVSA